MERRRCIGIEIDKTSYQLAVNRFKDQFETVQLSASSDGDSDTASTVDTFDTPVRPSAIADKPAADEPAAYKPAADEPVADKLAADKPAADKPAADTPADSIHFPLRAGGHQATANGHFKPANGNQRHRHAARFPR